MEYRFRVDRDVLGKVIAAGPRERWRLYDPFAAIAQHPFVEPDLRLQKEDDIVWVRVFGHTLVHYNIDHAARQVTVVDFEIIEDDRD